MTVRAVDGRSTARRTLRLLSVISSLPPSLCALAVRSWQFLFAFLQTSVTLAAEDFVWRVSSATAVMHSFPVIIRCGLKGQKTLKREQKAWKA